MSPSKDRFPKASPSLQRRSSSTTTRRCLSLCPGTLLRCCWWLNDDGQKNKHHQNRPLLFIIFFILIQVCCSKTQQTCRSSSTWVKVPVKQWTDTKVVLHPAECPGSKKVSGLRYAWRDWPCDFKACPVYSASRTLPAPPFISHRYEADGITWQFIINS